MNQTIFIAEKDKNLQKILKELLFKNDYMVNFASDEDSTLEYIKKNNPTLVVLDLNSEKSHQLILQKIKQKSNIPLVILAYDQALYSNFQEFNLVADDYIVKPFTPDEILIRIKIQLRDKNYLKPVLSISDLELNSEKLYVSRNGKEISLTPQEFKLLEYLLNNKEKIVTREMILSHIWHYSSGIKTRVVDVYMGYLRKKVDKGFTKELIHSIRGFGYVIKED